MKRNVGFIGLGTMGKPMAKNLLKAGFALMVYDVAEAPVVELTGMGAISLASPKDIAKNAEYVIVMVRNAAQVNEVLLGNKGVIEGIEADSTIIITSTIEPSVVMNLGEIFAQKGVNIIDTPVSRGQQAAIEGTLAITAGGDKKVIEDCHEILKAMASDIAYAGDLGSGQVAKIVSNYITMNSNIIISEAIVLGVKSGMHPERLLELVIGSSANSFLLEKIWAKKVLKGDFEPGFSLSLVLKDLGLALTLAKDGEVPVKMGALGYQIIQEECASDKGGKDFTAVVNTLEMTFPHSIGHCG